jgi:ABC-type phosphate/phosphonate transport system substrate-binding protein
MVDYGFAEVGATAASAVIKEYVDKGGKVLLKSKPVPIKELIASPNLPAQDLAHIQQYFLNLENSDEGQRRLAKLGYKGFASFDERQLVELGRWLAAEP